MFTVLNNVVKKQVSESVLKQNKAKETMKGWLIKVSIIMSVT